MSHEPNAPEVVTAAAVAEPPVDLSPPEPAFVARARRILAGDVRPDDYLPVPDEVRQAVADSMREIEAEHGFQVTDEAERHVLNRWTLDHHHPEGAVIVRSTDRGVLVLAAGEEQTNQLYLRRVYDGDYRHGFVLCYQSPW